MVQAYQRSVLQLMTGISRNRDRDNITNFKCNAKTHVSMDEKKFIPLYAEHLHFLVARAVWLITKIYQHFTYEQSNFKKDFVVMNQKSRRKGTSSFKCDFYKLLNNANFGNDCRNNINNCYFEPIYDEIGEISYIKKFDSIFDNEKVS